MNHESEDDDHPQAEKEIAETHFHAEDFSFDFLAFLGRHLETFVSKVRTVFHLKHLKNIFSRKKVSQAKSKSVPSKLLQSMTLLTEPDNFFSMLKKMCFGEKKIVRDYTSSTKFTTASFSRSLSF